MLQAPLPVVDGVAPSRVYLPVGPWATVLEFLLQRYPHLPPGHLQRRLQRGDIVDSRGMPQAVSTVYTPNQWLWYYREVPPEPKLPFDLPIVFADSALVVVDKPHFLASTPGGRYLHETALTRLRRDLDMPTLSPIHRLDRETAGLMVFCADPALRGAYQTLFQRREVHKVYEAVAPWQPLLTWPHVHRSHMVAGREFLMTEAEGAPNSETKFDLIRRLPDGMALYRALPVTGRKHQIRVHMNAMGIPIVNDELYPELQPQRDADDFGRPLQLLARAIAFVDPLSGRLREFCSTRRLLQDGPAMGSQPDHMDGRPERP